MWSNFCCGCILLVFACVVVKNAGDIRRDGWTILRGGLFTGRKRITRDEHPGKFRSWIRAQFLLALGLLGVAIIFFYAAISTWFAGVSKR
jgi:hypothetical protein